MKRVLLITCALTFAIGIAIALPLAMHIEKKREIQPAQLIAAEKSGNVGLSTCAGSEAAIRHYMDILLKNSPENPTIAIRIAPAFSPEQAIAIGNSGIYRVQMDSERTPETPNPKIRSETLIRIDPNLTKRLVAAASREIDHSDSTDLGGLDGTTYFFLHGQYCGRTWSPHGVTRAARIVDLVNILKQPDPDAESLKRAIISIENGGLR